MVTMSLDVPPPGDELHTDLASAELCAALADGLGVDPRMLSGRLALVAQLQADQPQHAVRLGEPGVDEAHPLERLLHPQKLVPRRRRPLSPSR